MLSAQVCQHRKKIGAGDGKAVLQASRQIDQQLQAAPSEQGESREEGTRILFHAPLAVTFEVDEPKKLVRILRAWAYCRANDRQDRPRLTFAAAC
jgi:hypothetical protein